MKEDEYRESGIISLGCENLSFVRMTKALHNEKLMALGLDNIGRWERVWSFYQQNRSKV